MAEGILSNEPHTRVPQTHDEATPRRGRPPLHPRRDERTITHGTADSLVPASEADAGGERSALAARELAEIGSIDVAHYDVGVLVIKCVDHFNARGPQVSAEREFLFERHIQIHIVREAR